MQKQMKQFKLRLDAETHRWVKVQAAKDCRTVNSMLNKMISDARKVIEQREETEKCAA